MPAFNKAAAAALAARSPQGFHQAIWADWGNWGESHNTLSPLGTPHAPHFPHFLSDDPLPNGHPWGDCTANNTNYYDYTPNTGVTRYFDWTITKGSCAPDGVNTTCLLTNGQFPGPAIEANWGDWISVKVTNEIPDEGTSLHWHGILQKGTPWEDGTPGISQCPIAPGASFTYYFQADLYGTSWWHSHYSSQYGSGLVGPMVIYGPKNADYDEDLGPIMTMDWSHEYYQTVVDALFEPLPAVNIPMSDNNLLNGKNSFDGNNAPLASFNITSGKTYRLRLINPSGAAVQKITLDNHVFTVIANDFVPIEPYQTDVITLSVGQRSDVLVKATGSPNDAVWLRAYKPPICWPTKGNDEVKAAIFYQHADQTVAPTSLPGPNAYNSYCGNDPLSETVPYYPITPPSPSVVEIMPLEFKSNGTNLLWYMQNRTFRVDFNDPFLFDAKNGNLNFPYIANVHNYGSNNSLLFVVENTGQQPHPMHMHGHNIFVLAEGDCVDNSTVFGNEAGVTTPGMNTSGLVVNNGTKRDLDIDYGTKEKRAGRGYGMCWDGHITNPSNPQRRDVHMLLPYQYIVVQWTQDNPGVWPFHCHIAWHLDAGFSWNIVERPDDIRNLNVDGSVYRTCTDWDAWSENHIVDQIDDGE